MTPTCFLDLDGVLVDFVGGACRLHDRPWPYGDPASHGRYKLDELWGMPASTFWAPMSALYWEELDLLPDGLQVLDLVERRFGRENVCILTAPTEDPTCAVGKIRWIRRHLPAEYAGQYLLGRGKHFCGHSGSVLIDDMERNCDIFAARGRSFLVPRPWNSGHATAADALVHLSTFLAAL